VDLHEVIASVAEELKAEAQRSKIELLVHPSAQLPHLHMDRPSVRQILVSLISASMRRVGQGRVEIATHRFNVAQGRSMEYPVPSGLTLRDGMWAAVAVSDNSQGYSPDTLYALTAHSADPNAGRTGPGLSMGETRLMAEALGGVLWHSKPPSGTCITFALPVA
jgi:signal transduction histidine kinase